MKMDIIKKKKHFLHIMLHVASLKIWDLPNIKGNYMKRLHMGPTSNVKSKKTYILIKNKIKY